MVLAARKFPGEPLSLVHIEKHREVLVFSWLHLSPMFIPLLKPGFFLSTLPHAPLELSHFVLNFLSRRANANINIYKAFSILKFSEDWLLLESSPRRIGLGSITKTKMVSNHSGMIESAIWRSQGLILSRVGHYGKDVSILQRGSLKDNECIDHSPITSKHHFLKIKEVSLSGLHLPWRVTWSCGFVCLCYTSAPTTDGCPPAFTQGQQEAK